MHKKSGFPRERVGFNRSEFVGRVEEKLIFHEKLRRRTGEQHQTKLRSSSHAQKQTLSSP